MPGEGLDELDRFDADADDLPDQADDIFGIVRPVGVGDAVAAGSGDRLDLVLVDNPVQGAAIAEPVVERLRAGCRPV